MSMKLSRGLTIFFNDFSFSLIVPGAWRGQGQQEKPRGAKLKLVS